MIPVASRTRAGSDGRTYLGPDGQPADNVVYNEDLLSWTGASGHENYARFFPVILATLITLIVFGSASEAGAASGAPWSP